MTIYRSVDELIQINLEMTEAFGGLSGVRDRGALEAATARPQTGYYKDKELHFAKAFSRIIHSLMGTNEPPLQQQPFSLK